MNQQNYAQIKAVMHQYITQGRRVKFKQKQFNRLVAILDEIMQIEDKLLARLGRKDIIGYYRRHSNESHNTLNEKYSILKKFFAEFKPEVTVPKPDPKKCGIGSDESA